MFIHIYAYHGWLLPNTSYIFDMCIYIYIHNEINTYVYINTVHTQEVLPTTLQVSKILNPNKSTLASNSSNQKNRPHTKNNHSTCFRNSQHEGHILTLIQPFLKGQHLKRKGCLNVNVNLTDVCSWHQSLVPRCVVDGSEIQRSQPPAKCINPAKIMGNWPYQLVQVQQ